MSKLSIFSKKLNHGLILDTGVGISISQAWLDNGWNNYSGSWLDNGWNNYSGSWLDNGWNNYSGSWCDNGWNNYSGSWIDSGWSNNSGGGGCYITSAAVEFMGLEDNCHELKTMRTFRDQLVEEDESFREQILDYYRYSPQILNKINESDNKDQILKDIYDQLIVTCVEYLENNKYEEAKKLYTDYFISLKTQFL